MGSWHLSEWLLVCVIFGRKVDFLEILEDQGHCCMLILLAVKVTGLIMGSWQNEFTNPQPPPPKVCLLGLGRAQG